MFYQSGNKEVLMIAKLTLFVTCFCIYFLKGGSDRWPIHSSGFVGAPITSNANNNGGGGGGNVQPPQRGDSVAIQQAHQARMNIESLQLPPNPVGPYMRQNREQLLAKQQILEQFARQQKQMQLSQQRGGSGLQQSHNTQVSSQQQYPISHYKNMGGHAGGKRLGQSDRPFSSSSSAGPPGFNNNTRYNDYQKNNSLNDRSSFYPQRSSNNNGNHSQHSPRPLSSQG